MSATKQSVLITGATSGLGREFAQLCVERGYELIVVARTEADLLSLKHELSQKTSEQITTFACDLSKPNEREKLIAKIGTQAFRVDILINNAGMGGHGPFLESDIAKEQVMVDLNIDSVVALTKAVLPQMVARKQGKILNLGSMASFLPGPYMAIYFASKAFILSFSEALAEELRATGVSVSVLCPGPLNTGFAREAGIAHSKTFNESKTSVRAVAEEGLEGLLTNTAIIIPGTRQKWTVLLSRFIPRRLLLSSIARMNKQI